MQGKKINPRDAYIIYQTYLEFGHSIALWLCKIMGYCERSYWNIIKFEGNTTPDAPRPRRTLWNESEMRMAASILANNPTLTLQEIIDDSVLQGFSRISPTTLFRYLQLDLKITRKRLNRWSQYRNTLNVKIQRINFFNMLSQIHSSLIWIDEFSVNLQITRNYGRSEMGERAVMVLPPNPGVNMNVCIAVDCDGLVYYECSVGGFDQVSFEIFLSNMTPQISQIKKIKGFLS